MSNLKKSIIKGTIWSVSGQMATLSITLITNIWLARILSPNEFGQLGIIMFFIAIANVLTESGLGGALVRKKEATKEDYSTVFVVNLAFSFICYLILVLSSGIISSFYNDPLIKKLLIVAGAVLIINAFRLTQNAKLISEMRFKERSIYSFISAVVSSAIGIVLAYRGLGVWSLIVIQLLTAIINTVLLWTLEGFYLRLYFSKASFKELYLFGINTTLASLLNTAFDNVYQLILGKYFSLSQAGYFYQAKKLQDVPGGVINSVSQSVVFSSLAKLQDDKEQFSSAYNKITLYFLVLLGFISSFIYIYAEPIILLLYGSKWIGAIFYMQLLTVASFFYIQENINRVIFKVFNQTRKILYLEYVKKTIQAISILIGVITLDFKILIIGFVITNAIGYFINYYYSRKIIGGVRMDELQILVKTIIVSVSTILISLLFESLLNLEEIGKFFTLPIFMIVYILMIYIYRVMDVKKEYKNVLCLMRSR